MKTNMTTSITALGLIAALFFVSGCQKQEGSAPVKQEVASVDTSAAEKEFQSAPPEVKSEVDKTLAFIKSGDYSSALSGLQTLAKDVKLTPEQKKVLEDLIAKVQQSVTSGAEKAVEGAQKSLDDVKSALPK
jgi:hypothetical protein